MEENKAVPELLIDTLRRIYGPKFFKIVLYSDGSGYLEAINGGRLFEFDNFAQLNAKILWENAVN